MRYIVEPYQDPDMAVFEDDKDECGFLACLCYSSKGDSKMPDLFPFAD